MSNTIDRFGDGIYTPAEVSRYLRLAESTVRHWTGSSGSADRQLVTSGQGFSGHARIPFVGLAEAYVLRAIRQTGVSMQRIRPALVRLQRESEVAHPLAWEHLYTDGVELLLDIADHSKEETAHAVKRLIVVRDGQHMMHEVVQGYLQRVSFRDGFADVVPLPAFGDGTVVADTSRGFGQPVFVASGARLVDALDLFAAGEDLTTVSAEYGVPLPDLEAALRGQLRTAA
jgi:uncharacterized protein (DUF433 family)